MLHHVVDIAPGQHDDTVRPVAKISNELVLVLQAMASRELMGGCVAKIVHVFDQLCAAELGGQQAPYVPVKVVRLHDVDAMLADVAGQAHNDRYRVQAFDTVALISVFKEPYAGCAKALFYFAAERIRHMRLDFVCVERAGQIEQVGFSAAQPKRLDDV